MSKFRLNCTYLEIRATLLIIIMLIQGGGGAAVECRLVAARSWVRAPAETVTGKFLIANGRGGNLVNKIPSSKPVPCEVRLLSAALPFSS